MPQPLRRWVIVIPTYNEAANLPELVERLMALPFPDKVIVIVDDGSPDGTGEVAERLARRYAGQLHVVHRPRRLGLRTAYQDGFRYALALGADVIVQIDADGSHDPAALPAMAACLQDADVVVGSRYVPGGGMAPGCGWIRRWLSRWANEYVRWVAGLRVRDAMAGFRILRRSAVEALDWKRIGSRGYAFQMETVWWWEQEGRRVVERPIVFHPRRAGRSKLTPGIVVEVLWRVWVLRWRRVLHG